MKKNSLFVFFFFVFLTGGCGYTTRAYVTQTGYKTIYIKPFLNKVNTTSEYSEGKRFQTYFPLLENTITHAVADRFLGLGNLIHLVKASVFNIMFSGCNGRNGKSYYLHLY